MDVRFSTDGTRIVAHDELLTTFVFDAAGGPTRPTPLVGERRASATWGGRRRPHGRRSEFGRPPRPPYFVTAVDGQDDLLRENGLNPRSAVTNFQEVIDTGFLVRASRIAFTPDRTIVAMVNSEGAVQLFRTDTKQPVGEPIEHVVDGERDHIRAVKFCPMGERLLTCSRRRPAGIWSAVTGAKVDLLPNRIGIQLTRFSPSGKLVLGATNFSMAQAWDANGQAVTPLPMVHGGQVWGVAADPKDERIITASFDRTARIWDRKTGRPLSTPLMHKQGVSDADVQPRR